MFKRRRLRISNKKIMYSMLVFVLIGITTMTIAYATLSTTLRITGSAEFEDASWSLSLQKYNIPDYWLTWPELQDATSFKDNVLIYGKAKLVTAPTVTGTSILNSKISLGQLGDQIYQEFILINDGEIPAVIGDIIYGDIEVESSTNNQDDIALVNEYFGYWAGFYKFYYDEEEGIWYEGGYYDNPYDVVLCPGARIGVELWSGYSSSAPRVPYEKITVSNMNVDFNFVAADQNLCDGIYPVETNG